MNIGFVTTWFERGAAYVTKSYIEALEDKHDVFVYARGGENYAKGNPEWDLPFVTWGLNLSGTRINPSHFKRWIKENKIEIIFFNEQREIEILAYIKKVFPFIIIGAYIDYYKENEIENFWLYDFLICNTRRHYSVFKEHPQCYYVPWGTDTEIFTTYEKNDDTLTFFHSVGMSTRKGTDLLLKAYINAELYKESKLIIHSQINIKKYFGYGVEELGKYNIKIIERTVGSPGLYHLGDVYVYPTTLDGLGLTLYEALSCGLPVITTNNAPMNEVINDRVGFLVEVDKYYSRSDGYYWPLSICCIESLAIGMKYFISNKVNLAEFKKKARQHALDSYNWRDRYESVTEIFESVKKLNCNIDFHHFYKKSRRKRMVGLIEGIEEIIPDRISHFVNVILKKKL